MIQLYLQYLINSITCRTGLVVGSFCDPSSCEFEIVGSSSSKPHYDMGGPQAIYE